MAKTVNETFEFTGCEPEDVYSVLMDSDKMSELSDYESTFSPEVGDELKAFNGEVVGRTIYSDPNRMVAFSWRRLARKRSIPDSILSIAFYKEGDKTKLEVANVNVPDYLADTEMPFMNEDSFWRPLKRHMEEQQRKSQEERAADERSRRDEEQAAREEAQRAEEDQRAQQEHRTQEQGRTDRKKERNTERKRAGTQAGRKKSPKESSSKGQRKKKQQKKGARV